MAINLATKYSDKIATAFILGSVVDGRASKDYKFDGASSILVNTPVTQPLNDYARTGDNRYGSPTEMQDTQQRLTLTRDRSFSITIDKGNNKEQMEIKEAGKMLRLEIDEQVIPEMDKYALNKFGDSAGKIEALSSAPTKTTITGALSDGMVHMSNKKIPAENRTIFITWTNFGLLRLSPEFIGNEALGQKALVKGKLGEFMGADVVPVPGEFLQKTATGSAHFLITHKSAIMQPKTIEDYFVHVNPPGLNGARLEGRFRFDAFVLGVKSDGVYLAAATSSARQPAPTNTYASETKAVTIASTGANKLRYTLDGSDPRYSATALEASGASVAVDLAAFSGTTVIIKSVAMSATLYTSAITETSQAVAAG